MPSQAELPTVEELRRAFLTEALAAARDRGEQADDHAGAIYDHFAGVGAILFNRVAARDQSEFRALYFGQADSRGVDLIATTVGRERVEGAKGIGLLRVSRTAGAAGWFRRGTRVAAGGGFKAPEYFALSADRWYSAADDNLALDVESSSLGAPAMRMAAGDPGVLAWEDPILDGWTIDSLDVASGAARENDSAVRAALVDGRRVGRVGYARALADACKAEGATFVAFFASDYLGGADGGLNRIYVADSADTASESLLRACRIAIASVGMAGTALQVLPSELTAIEVDLVVTMHDRVNASGHLASDVIGAVVDYFSDVVLWRTSAIEGAVFRALPGLVQDVDVVLPTGEPAAALPATLPRYVVPASAVRVSFVGPS